ncbi:MAG: phosphatidylserine decarboxylase [Candidatus Pacebacteria bacterium]|nr:phosphatidylserine decarboxylase [Candidatus Paceibacterota bacterium]
MSRAVPLDIPPIHRAGYPFIALFVIITALLFVFVSPILGWLGVVLSLWCCWFFRNPMRTVPQGEGLIIAPADGQVLLIEKAPLPPEVIENLGGKATAKTLTRVSIFMSVFDVHVNRSPMAGVVAAVLYRPGKFLSAGLDKASTDNERSTMIIDLASGQKLVVVQIAGLVARRILSFVKPGDRLAAGERYGLIRFGSRVDIFLPDGVNPLVAEGQWAVGGETIIADVNSKQLPLKGKRV